MNISQLLPVQLVDKVSRTEGLPSHQIHSMCFSHRKFWLSTPNGLAIYNGEEVEILNKSSGLLTHGQRSVSSYGDLIFVCSDLGLDILDANTTSVLASIDTVKHNLGWCQCCLLIADNLYLLGCGKGLYLWNSVSNKLSQVSQDIDREGVVNMVQSPDNLVLIQLSQSGVWIFKNGILSPLLKKESNIFSKIEYINITNFGFFITNNSHILLLDFELKLKEQIPLPTSKKSAVKVLAPQGNILIVADHEKVYELVKQDGQWSEGKLICDNVQMNDLAYDNFNNLWIATELSGLFKYSALNNYVQIFKAQKPLSILAIRAAQNNQEFLIGGTGSSFIVTTTKPQQPIAIKSLDNLACWDLYQDARHGIWAACNQGLAYIESKDQTTPDVFRSKEVGAGRCLLALEDDFLYGSVYGLFLFSKQSKAFKAINDENNNTLSYVYSIVRKSASQIFICTLGRGLWIYNCDNGSLSKVNLLHKYLNVYDIHSDDNDRAIIAADNHILLMENNELKIICKSSDSVAAWCCRWYDESLILLGSSKGLRVFDIKKKRFVYEINNIPEQQYWEFTTSRSLAKSDNGQYWCGLNETLVTLKLESLLQVIHPPIPEIKSIKSSTDIIQKGTSVAIKEGSWNLDIKLCSYWLWDEKSILYYYRLVGFHDNWRQAQHTPIMYSSLAAGEYILEVKVCNSLAQSSQNYQLLLLRITKSGHFYNVLNAVKKLFTNLYGQYRRRKNFWKLSETNLELERLVKHRTSELSLANEQLQEANQSLELLSNKDQLTGLYNRRAFFKFADDEIQRAARLNTVFSILMIDIDYFKPFNDNYGHLAGDICLKQVAECLSGCLHRSGDIIARYGGEEFIIALPNVELHRAQRFANICVNTIRDRGITHEFSSVSSHVSISVGLSSSTVAEELTQSNRTEFLLELIAQADSNLYKAKENGRNQYI